MATTLFPADVAAAAAAHKPLVEFRAGRMNRNGTKVKSDPRKGLFYMDVGAEDQLLHLFWKDRQTGTAEEDLILFPDDAKFERVPQCTTGRVYVLRFNSSDRRLFFWMQEPKTDKDDELSARVNQILASTNPSALAASPSSTARGRRAASTLDSLLGNRAPRFGRTGGRGAAPPGPLGAAGRGSSRPASAAPAAAPATPAPAATATASAARSTPAPAGAPSAAAAAPSTPAPAGSSQQRAQLLQMINDIAGGLQMPSAMDVDRAGSGPSLQQVLTRDNVAVLLDDPAVCERLYPLLPEGAPRTRTELESVVRSPQFHQAVEALNAGLQSGQASSLATQLGLDTSFVGGPFAGVEAFLQAIRDHVARERGGA